MTLTTASGTATVAYTSATRLNAYGGSAAVGHYAIVAGTGSASSPTANYVATFTTKPGTVQVSGTYVGATAYGIEIKDSIHGIIPVLEGTGTTISGSPAAGASVSVSGTGSPDSAILATSVSTSGSSASPTPNPIDTPSTGGGTGVISQTHVLTADYFGTPYGSTSVTPSRAAPYLSWASSGLANANSISAAGIKTESYFIVNRTQTTDPLYHQASEAAFDHTCGNARVHDYFDHVTQYVMNNGSSALRSEYASYVASQTSGKHLDAVFEDNAAPLGANAPGFYSPGLPCSYSDATYLSNEEGLEASINHNTIFNGLNALNGHNVSETLQLLNNPSTIGGNYEACFTVMSSTPEQPVWVWTATEQTQLDVTAKHKLFQCMGSDLAPASSSIPSRLYSIASFLMTYNPTYSILWDSYATPSRVSVMPESQLVPLNPVVSTPSSISSLQTSTGVYAREYRTCYYAGRSIGACAMVVNNDRLSHAAPHLSLAYHHTLSLSGNGILDGGTVSFGGSAPPSSMAPLSAYVAVP